MKNICVLWRPIPTDNTAQKPDHTPLCGRLLRETVDFIILGTNICPGGRPVRKNLLFS